MKNLIKVLVLPLLFLVTLFLLLFLTSKVSKPVYAASCTFSSPSSVVVGQTLTISVQGTLSDTYVVWVYNTVTTVAQASITGDGINPISITLSFDAGTAPGSYTVDVADSTNLATCTTSNSTLTVTSGGGGNGWSLTADTSVPFQATFTCGGCPNANVEIFVVGTSAHSGAMTTSTWTWYEGPIVPGTYTANLVAFGSQIVATTPVTVGSGGGGNVGGGRCHQS